MRKLLQWVLREDLDQNGWFLCLEIFWSSIFGVATSFNVALAVRLGATNTQVSWLASGGALLGLVVMPLAGRFLQSRSKHRPWVLFALLLSRLGTVLLIAATFVPLPAGSAGLLVIVVMLLLTVPMHFFNIGFVAFLSESVRMEARATVFSARNALSGVALAVLSVLFGWLLVALPFPLNYQIVLSLGLVCALLSSYYLTRVAVVEPSPAPAPAPAGPAAPQRTLRQRWAEFVAGLKAAPGFVQFSVNTFLHAMGMWAAGPLVTLYLLHEVKIEENWLGIIGSATSVAAILGYMFWRPLMARWGESKTLKVTITLLGLYPLLLGLTGWLPLVVLACMTNGWVSAGVNLSHFNTMLRVVPADKRHDYTALNQTAMSVGIMIAPLISVALANLFGFGPVLVVCGALSIVGAASFWIWPVGEGPLPVPATLPEASAAGH